MTWKEVILLSFSTVLIPFIVSKELCRDFLTRLLWYYDSRYTFDG